MLTIPIETHLLQDRPRWEPHQVHILYQHLRRCGRRCNWSIEITQFGELHRAYGPIAKQQDAVPRSVHHYQTFASGLLCPRICRVYGLCPFEARRKRCGVDTGRVERDEGEE